MLLDNYCSGRESALPKFYSIICFSGGKRLKLIQCKGYELTKAQPNTSEDFFTRSEATFYLDGEERTLHVLYVKFFEEQAKDILPYSAEPLFQTGEREIYLRDIVALIYLMQHPQGKIRKRIFVNDQLEFLEYLKNANYKEIESMVRQLEQR